MEIERFIAKGQVVPLLFQQAAVAASQTDSDLPVAEVGIIASLVLGHTVPFAGSIVGISASLNDASSAGELTVGASIGGTEDALSTMSIATETEKYLAIPRGNIPFVAGNVLGVQISTDASWTPETRDLTVQLWALVELEDV